MRPRLICLASLLALPSACTGNVPIGDGGDPGGGAASGTATSGAGAGAPAGTGATTSGTGGAGAFSTGGSGGDGTGGSDTHSSAGVGGDFSTGGAGAGAGVGGAGVGGGAGSCPSLETNVLHHIPSPKAVDVRIVGTDVYWSVAGSFGQADGALWRAPLATGQAEPFASPALDPGSAGAFELPDAIVADDTYVYWRASSGKSLWRKPIGGGSAASISTVSGLGVAQGYFHGTLAIDATNVYWVQGPNPAGSQQSNYGIHSAPKDGGPAALLGSFTSDVVDLDKPFNPLSLDTDGSSLFYGLSGGPAASSVNVMGIDGANPTELFGTGLWVAQAGSDVFSATSDFVWRLPKSGAQSVIVAGPGSEPGTLKIAQNLVEDAGALFFSSLGTVLPLGCCSCGWISTVPSDAQAATPTVLWSGTGRPAAVDASGGYVVAADIDNGEVIVLQP